MCARGVGVVALDPAHADAQSAHRGTRPPQRGECGGGHGGASPLAAAALSQGWARVEGAEEGHHAVSQGTDGRDAVGHTQGRGGKNMRGKGKGDTEERTINRPLSLTRLL